MNGIKLETLDNFNHEIATRGLKCKLWRELILKETVHPFFHGTFRVFRFSIPVDAVVDLIVLQIGPKWAEDGSEDTQGKIGL